MTKYIVTVEDIEFPPDERGLLSVFAGGAFRVEKWTLESGVLHREDGPAISVGSAGVPARGEFAEIWYRNGLLHRDGAPAVVVKEPMYHTTRTQYFKDGLLHRDDGHADVIKELFGNVVNARFVLNGVEVPDIPAKRSLWNPSGREI